MPIFTRVAIVRRLVAVAPYEHTTIACAMVAAWLRGHVEQVATRLRGKAAANPRQATSSGAIARYAPRARFSVRCSSCMSNGGTLMFDFGECFTRSARLVVRRAADRGLKFTFDADVPPLPVEGDGVVVERSLYRLLLASLDYVDAGVLAIAGSVNASGLPTVRLTGAGSLVGGERLVRLLEDLELTSSGLTRGTLMAASGRCPIAGAELMLVHDETEGFVLEATMPFALSQEPSARLPSAQGAVAWVFLPNNPIPSVFKRRLERLGWSVVLFRAGTAVDEALDRLADAPPQFLLAQALHPSANKEVQRWFKLPIPPSVQRVLGVPLGHPALEDEHPDYQVQALPFSPLDLAVLTAAHEPEFDVGTLPQGLWSQDARPSLMVVDDNPVNQAVMGAMGEAMGYEVLQADNGQLAIDLCARNPPSAVLMDVNMPVMDGLTATRQLRAMQRAGSVAPFPILGASADATPDNEAACLSAGMDTFIAKPLMIAEVAAQLRRLSLDAPQRTAW